MVTNKRRESVLKKLTAAVKGCIVLEKITDLFLPPVLAQCNQYVLYDSHPNDPHVLLNDQERLQ